MVRIACLLLTVLTGFTGLVYEVVWQKYLATLLGSHGEATAAVLAIFLGGLSAGYALFGDIARRSVLRARESGEPPRVLRLYAAVELGIGVYALAFPLLFGVAEAFSLWVPRGHPAASFAFDVALCTLLIGPPTVLMGGTIPLLTQALAGSLAEATRVHAWIYATNTLGAFAGALAGGFLLVPQLGLDGAMRAMAALNLLAGTLFGLLSPRALSLAAPDASAAGGAAPAALRGYAAVALLAGFAMMALQTLFNRIGALSLGASPFTFSMVVAVFVLCMAIGSLAVSLLPRIPSGCVHGSLWALVALLTLLYPFVPDATYWSHAIRVLFRSVDPAFLPFHFVTFCALFVALALPIGLSGALLPLLFHQLRRELADLGAVAGRLYAWNTVGSLLGALLGGYLLLIWLDLHHVYRIAVAALAIAAMILTLRVRALRPRWIDALMGLAIVGAVAALPPWDPAELTSGGFRHREPTEWSFAGPGRFFEHRRPGRLVFHDDDPTTTVSVLETERADERIHRSLFVNGKSDGSLYGDYPTTGMLALVPALLAERHERCFVIGYGTGVTAGELASLEETREVQVAEISQGVLDAAPLFDHGNLRASRNPKIRVRRGDAYRSLLQSPDLYDVIVSEPSNPWVTGVEMLYSVEFLEAARSRLTPGGVYAQWFHLYETDMQVVELVLRSYTAVFPHVSVWFTMTKDLILVGTLDAERALDVSQIAQRFSRPDFSAGFERVGIPRLGALLAHELLPMGVVHAAALHGPLHGLRHPRLSDRAARAFFRGDAVRMPKWVRLEAARIGARNSLLRRYGGAQLPESLLDDAVRETCGLEYLPECATLLALWQRDHPDSPLLAAALADVRRIWADPILQDGRIADLARLFDAEVEFGEVRRPLLRAQRVTDQFLDHYHHAAPFDRRVLERVWDACEREGCEAPRRRLESRIGPLAPGS
jgi:spermidine synthase